MIHLDGIQWKYIHVGNDYVNTHSLAYTLNKFPFIFLFQKTNFFFIFPPPPNNNYKSQKLLDIFINIPKCFFLGPPPPSPQNRNDGES